MKSAIAKANAALDQIGAQDSGKVTFKSTVAALDDVTYEASLAANRATLIKETNTNPAMRTAAENAVKAFQDWVVGVDYREDVYKAIKDLLMRIQSSAAKTKSCSRKRYAIIAVPVWICLLNSARKLRNCAKSYQSWEQISTPTSLNPTLRHVQQSRSRWASGKLLRLARHQNRRTTFTP